MLRLALVFTIISTAMGAAKLEMQSDEEGGNLLLKFDEKFSKDHTFTSLSAYLTKNHEAVGFNVANMKVVKDEGEVPHVVIAKADELPDKSKNDYITEAATEVATLTAALDHAEFWTTLAGLKFAKSDHPEAYGAIGVLTIDAVTTAINAIRAKIRTKNTTENPADETQAFTMTLAGVEWNHATTKETHELLLPYSVRKAGSKATTDKLLPIGYQAINALVEGDKAVGLRMMFGGFTHEKLDTFFEKTKANTGFDESTMKVAFATERLAYVDKRFADGDLSNLQSKIASDEGIDDFERSLLGAYGVNIETVLELDEADEAIVGQKRHGIKPDGLLFAVHGADDLRADFPQNTKVHEFYKAVLGKITHSVYGFNAVPEDIQNSPRVNIGTIEFQDGTAQKKELLPKCLQNYEGAGADVSPYFRNLRKVDDTVINIVYDKNGEPEKVSVALSVVNIESDMANYLNEGSGKTASGLDSADIAVEALEKMSVDALYVNEEDNKYAAALAKVVVGDFQEQLFKATGLSTEITGVNFSTLEIGKSLLFSANKAEEDEASTVNAFFEPAKSAQLTTVLEKIRTAIQTQFSVDVAPQAVATGLKDKQTKLGKIKHSGEESITTLLPTCLKKFKGPGQTPLFKKLGAGNLPMINIVYNEMGKPMKVTLAFPKVTKDAVEHADTGLGHYLNGSGKAKHGLKGEEKNVNVVVEEDHPFLIDALHFHGSGESDEQESEQLSEAVAKLVVGDFEQKVLAKGASTLTTAIDEVTYEKLLTNDGNFLLQFSADSFEENDAESVLSAPIVSAYVEQSETVQDAVKKLRSAIEEVRTEEKFPGTSTLLDEGVVKHELIKLGGVKLKGEKSGKENTEELFPDCFQHFNSDVKSGKVPKFRRLGYKGNDDFINIVYDNTGEPEKVTIRVPISPSVNNANVAAYLNEGGNGHVSYGPKDISDVVKVEGNEHVRINALYFQNDDKKETNAEYSEKAAKVVVGDFQNRIFVQDDSIKAEIEAIKFEKLSVAEQLSLLFSAKYNEAELSVTAFFEPAAHLKAKSSVEKVRAAIKALFSAGDLKLIDEFLLKEHAALGKVALAADIDAENAKKKLLPVALQNFNSKENASPHFRKLGKVDNAMIKIVYNEMGKPMKVTLAFPKVTKDDLVHANKGLGHYLNNATGKAKHGLADKEISVVVNEDTFFIDALHFKNDSGEDDQQESEQLSEAVAKLVVGELSEKVLKNRADDALKIQIDAIDYAALDIENTLLFSAHSFTAEESTNSIVTAYVEQNTAVNTVVEKLREDIAAVTISLKENTVVKHEQIKLGGIKLEDGDKKATADKEALWPKCFQDVNNNFEGRVPQFRKLGQDNKKIQVVYDKDGKPSRLAVEFEKLKQSDAFNVLKAYLDGDAGPSHGFDSAEMEVVNQAKAPESLTANVVLFDKEEHSDSLLKVLVGKEVVGDLEKFLLDQNISSGGGKIDVAIDAIDAVPAFPANSIAFSANIDFKETKQISAGVINTSDVNNIVDGIRDVIFNKYKSVNGDLAMNEKATMHKALLTYGAIKANVADIDVGNWLPVCLRNFDGSGEAPKFRKLKEETNKEGINLVYNKAGQPESVKLLFTKAKVDPENALEKYLKGDGAKTTHGFDKDTMEVKQVEPVYITAIDFHGEATLSKEVAEEFVGDFEHKLLKDVASGAGGAETDSDFKEALEKVTKLSIPELKENLKFSVINPADYEKTNYLVTAGIVLSVEESKNQEFKAAIGAFHDRVLSKFSAPPSKENMEKKPLIIGGIKLTTEEGEDSVKEQEALLPAGEYTKWEKYYEGDGDIPEPFSKLKEAKDGDEHGGDKPEGDKPEGDGTPAGDDNDKDDTAKDGTPADGGNNNSSQEEEEDGNGTNTKDNKVTNPNNPTDDNGTNTKDKGLPWPLIITIIVIVVIVIGVLGYVLCAKKEDEELEEEDMDDDASKTSDDDEEEEEEEDADEEGEEQEEQEEEEQTN